MYIVTVKDRGRIVALHRFDSVDDAHEMASVYQLLGYDVARIELHQEIEEQAAAA